MTVPKLVSFGNFTIDDVVMTGGETRDGCIGGDALYATLAARAFEPRSELVAPIGNDMPQHVIDRMAALSLSMDGMPPRDVPNLHNRVEYKADGSRQWTLYNPEDHFDTLSPYAGDVPADYLGADRFLVLAMALGAQESLIEQLSGMPGTITALDPQEDYIADNEKRLETLISKVGIFMPSEEEVVRLTGLRDWPVAAERFAALGPQIVIIKLGADGCYLYDRGRQKRFVIPAYEAEQVVDTTGAGDSFCGAFMAALATMTPEHAAMAGAIAASVTVSGYGVDPLFETPSHVIAERFDAWRASTEFVSEADGVMQLHPIGGG